ncbi:MAG: riboflavin biosynthesis protein RibF, partial [Chitinivibrionales bacterium]|nr:riboflavin biosynthesis protein RibF [Chitinivibrionales bacterium]MBD3357302.1 riboflavin biosynthesis protein RibF [Chitinivibrionales bacterium]
MKVIGQDASLPPGTQTVVSVGNFDGIHRGHRTLIRQTIQRARSQGLSSAVVTFVPHTRAMLNPDEPPFVLTTCEEKAHLLSGWEVDYLVCLRFDQAMASLSPEEFLEKILVDRLGTREWIMGEDHAFGKDRLGTKEFLHKRYGKYDINI